MTLSAPVIAELICTRISHDVIGNVGAVANAVELLEEGDMDFMDDIKSILKTSSVVLSARLKFFRMAFGLDNANLEKMDVVKSVTEDYLATIGSRNHPVSLEFGLQSPAGSKIAMLSVMILAETLVRGGTVSVTEQAGRLTVSAAGEVPPSADKLARIKNVLCGQDTEPNAQFAPVWYLLSLIKQANINLYLLNSPQTGFVFA